MIEVRINNSHADEFVLKNPNITEVITLTATIFRTSPPKPSDSEWQILSADLYNSSNLSKNVFKPPQCGQPFP